MLEASPDSFVALTELVDASWTHVRHVVVAGAQLAWPRTRALASQLIQSKLDFELRIRSYIASALTRWLHRPH